MTLPAPPIHELRLVAYMRSRLRDPDNKLFEDSEYENYLESTSCSCSRDPISTRAYRRGTSDMFKYQACMGYLWRVELDSPTAGQNYVINEASFLIFNPESGETADYLAIKGYPVDVDLALYRCLLDAANNPAKAAVYMQANGFTADTRDGARALREQAQHILGVR